jgi:hypothetical protein
MKLRECCICGESKPEDEGRVCLIDPATWESPAEYDFVCDDCNSRCDEPTDDQIDAYEERHGRLQP